MDSTLCSRNPAAASPKLRVCKRWPSPSKTSVTLFTKCASSYIASTILSISSTVTRRIRHSLNLCFSNKSRCRPNESISTISRLMILSRRSRNEEKRNNVSGSDNNPPVLAWTVRTFNKLRNIIRFTDSLSHRIGQCLTKKIKKTPQRCYELSPSPISSPQPRS